MHISGSFIQIFMKNIIIMGAWHLLVLFTCIYINKKLFNPNRRMYKPYKWEKNGLWYKKHLHINKWKDLLPQHIGKDGFSKEHLISVTPEYFDEFIMETCRAEWNHTLSCLCIIFTFILNSFWTALCLSIIPLICNLPFIAIQRYNRFRLQILKSKIIKRNDIKCG